MSDVYKMRAEIADYNHADICNAHHQRIHQSHDYLTMSEIASDVLRCLVEDFLLLLFPYISFDSTDTIEVFLNNAVEYIITTESRGE